MTRVYAIGDIHGHLDKLARAHALIAADRHRTGDADAPVVHLGDLVDRGPESAEVIDYLVTGPVRPGTWITIRGNHDHLFRLFLADPAARDPVLRPDLTWLDPRIGGVATLESYGIHEPASRKTADLQAEALARIPAAHLAFLDGARSFVAMEGVFLAHAGIRPGTPLARQDPTDLMWILLHFLQVTGDHGALIVHGHTPEGEVPRHFGNRLSVDTGAAYGGPLSAVVIKVVAV
ncbi:MAG: serine/threonine protein phosphatase [Rubellimicrobium sp.]|nr:serine/threonine protein phosphatase [Rubellimicrobium sp.]